MRGLGLGVVGVGWGVCGSRPSGDRTVTSPHQRDGEVEASYREPRVSCCSPLREGPSLRYMLWGPAICNSTETSSRNHHTRGQPEPRRERLCNEKFCSNLHAADHTGTGQARREGLGFRPCLRALACRQAASPSSARRRTPKAATGRRQLPKTRECSLRARINLRRLAQTVGRIAGERRSSLSLPKAKFQQLWMPSYAVASTMLSCMLALQRTIPCASFNLHSYHRSHALCPRSARIDHRVHRTLAPSGLTQPIALWLFGPSAVGKSFIRDASAFEVTRAARAHAARHARASHFCARNARQ